MQPVLTRGSSGRLTSRHTLLGHVGWILRKSISDLLAPLRSGAKVLCLAGGPRQDLGSLHWRNRASHSTGLWKPLDPGLQTDHPTWGCPLQGEEAKLVEAKGFGQRSGRQVAHVESLSGTGAGGRKAAECLSAPRADMCRLADLTRADLPMLWTSGSDSSC